MVLECLSKVIGALRAIVHRSFPARIASHVHICAPIKSSEVTDHSTSLPMESPSSPCPPSTVRRNPPRRAKKAPCAKTLPASASTSVENLNVFLRIRPLQVLPQVLARKPPKVDARANGKGGARKVDRERTGECLTVNGPSSVTLQAPSSLLDSKRIKNELYDGFSYVFPPDSSQVRFLVVLVL